MSQTRNIAFFESITSYWIDLQNDLYKSGFECYYIYEKYESFDIDALKKQLDFSPHKVRRGRKNSPRLFELASILRKYNPEVVISIEYSLLTLQLWLLKHILRMNFSLIARTDDSIAMVRQPMTKLHKMAREFLITRIDNAIICDHDTYLYYRQNYGTGIYFPILRDDDIFRKQLEDSLPLSKRLIKEYKLEGKTVFLYVGRIIPVKNIELVLEAFKSVSVPDSVFIVVGDGDSRQKLESESSDCKIPVIFTGIQRGEDLMAWYDIADIFILPSKREPFGAVVNESLIAGCIDIISARAGSAHLIDEGNNGFLIDPDCVDSMIDAIEKAMNLCDRKRDKGILKGNRMSKPYSLYFQNLVQHLK